MHHTGTDTPGTAITEPEILPLTAPNLNNHLQSKLLKNSQKNDFIRKWADKTQLL